LGVAVGVGEDVAGAATLTAVPGAAMATTAMGIVAMAMGIMAMGIMAVGIMAMATVTMAMATVITGMAITMERAAGILPGRPIQADTQVRMPGQAEDLRLVALARMERPAGFLPGYPIQADTQVGMPGQTEDLRLVDLAEPDSPADTMGLWPQQDIRADQLPPGGVNLARSQRDTPPRKPQPEQTVRAQPEQLRPGHAKRPGLSRQGPLPRGLRQGLASR